MQNNDLLCRMVPDWFLVCRVFSDRSILKKRTGNAEGISSFSHSWPTLSLWQALQVLTWFSLKMDTCPLGAHSQPCWSHCKDACWLPYWLTNPHARWDQAARSPPLHLVPRSGVIWTSHPLNSRLDTFLGRYPGLRYPNAPFELPSSFHLCFQEGGVNSQQWVPSPSLIILLGLQALAKTHFPWVCPSGKTKRKLSLSSISPWIRTSFLQKQKECREEKVLILDVSNATRAA